MKHIHKFTVYKEIQVPNGKYLVNKHTKIDIHDIQRGFADETVKALTSPALIVYCRTCGDVKIKSLEKKTIETKTY